MTALDIPPTIRFAGPRSAAAGASASPAAAARRGGTLSRGGVRRAALRLPAPRRTPTEPAGHRSSIVTDLVFDLGRKSASTVSIDSSAAGSSGGES
jgi:hypothetical protein